MAAALAGKVAVTNPLDYHTFIWGDQARLTECFRAALGTGPLVGSSAPFDAAVLVIDFPAEGVDRSRWWPTLDAFGAACAATRTPGVVVASMAENLPEEARARAAALGLAACGDIDTALSALATAAALGRRSAQPSRDSDCLLPPASVGGSGSSVRSASSSSSVSLVEPHSSVGATPSSGSQRTYGRGVTADSWSESSSVSGSPSRRADGPDAASEPTGSVLLEHEAKQRLAAAGIAVPLGRVVAAEQAPAAAADIEYPVVVKAVGAVHKTETGGVVVGLSELDAVVAAARRLSGDGVEAVLVESCVTDAVAELLIGVRSSPPVGMMLTLGAGGTLAELVDDTASLLLPVEPGEVLDALRGLRVWPLLDGLRGRPPAAVDAVVEVVSALGALVRDDRSIVEVEINPLMVTPHAAVAADALMLVAEPQVRD